MREPGNRRRHRLNAAIQPNAATARNLEKRLSNPPQVGNLTHGDRLIGVV
jgi:hypothetical protein